MKKRNRLRQSIKTHNEAMDFVSLLILTNGVVAIGVVAIRENKEGNEIRPSVQLILF